MERNRILSSLATLGFAAAGCLAPGGDAISNPELPPVSAPPASAQAGSEADRSFEQFCATWMGKLATRERDNVQGAKARQQGSLWVLEYTGYARDFLRCEAKATGKRSNPFVGKLVYTEAQYRKKGDTQAAARSGSATMISQTEVMEIFRFDGSRWVY